MVPRVVLVLVVVLALAGCSADRPKRADASPSASAPAERPVEDYNLDDESIPKLGFALQPVPAGRGLPVGGTVRLDVTLEGRAQKAESAHVRGSDLNPTASLLQWLKDEGWAPEGRRWLLVRPRVRLAALDSDQSATTDLAADPTLTGPGGRLPIPERRTPPGPASSATTVPARSTCSMSSPPPSSRGPWDSTSAAPPATPASRRGTRAVAASGSGGDTWCGTTNQLRL
jgi:hypothetical protein